jgi:SAM-dependent methyltransferase
MSSPFDQIEYPSIALPQTWPDRLGTLAVLHGLRPAVEDCRLLELGCGDGLNLIAMAVAMPRARCVGIELAAQPVARGRALIDRVGVSSVTLHHMDASDVREDLGTFDYVVAHGFYSWVPPVVRDRLLSICRAHLAPHGVAYVSFNALPGGYLRQMCRRMMMYHIRNVEDPRRRVAEARNLLAFLVRAHAPDHPITHLLRIELERIASLPDGQVFHDDLAPVNDAVACDEFASHAAGHGLQYLCDAELESISLEGLPPWVRGQIHNAAGDDVLARQMYVDFVRDTTYRQTLLCRADAKLTRPPAPANVRGLYVASDAGPVSPHPEVHTPKMESFRAPSGADVSSPDPLAKGAMVALAGAWPRALRFEELLEAARSRAQVRTDESHDDHLARILLTLCAGGLVQLHARPRAATADVCERPLASPLARVQAAIGATVTTLDGLTLRLENATVRQLLTRLDGTRDRAELRAGWTDSTIALDAALLELGRAGLLLS